MYFNHLFINIASNISNRLPDTAGWNQLSILVNKTICLKAFYFCELSNLLNSKLKISYSAGLDDVTSHIMVFTSSVPVFTYLLNLSFEQGQFPDSLKKVN